MVSWTLHVFLVLLLVSSNITKPDEDTLFSNQLNINVAEYSDYADKILSLRDKYTHVGK